MLSLDRSNVESTSVGHLKHPPRRRGGWRERASTDAMERDVPDHSVSRLAAMQLQCRADGELPASKLHTTMMYAVSDGSTQPMVSRLSRIRPRQYSHRSLLSVLQTRNCHYGRRSASC